MEASTTSAIVHVSFSIRMAFGTMDLVCTRRKPLAGDRTSIDIPSDCALGTVVSVAVDSVDADAAPLFAFFFILARILLRGAAASE
jgi:hypothetical protein